MSKLRKVYIVIEETGEEEICENGHKKGRPFNVYLDGDIERLKDSTLNPDELSAAEFWGSRLFSIVRSALKQTGAVHSEIDRSKIV